MDGFQVAAQLRQSGLDKAVLIALTGYGQDDVRHRAANSGFNHHLVKPVSLDTLQSILAGAAPGGKQVC
jgi:two-component system CheB/CheR fusion protein